MLVYASLKDPTNRKSGYQHLTLPVTRWSRRMADLHARGTTLRRCGMYSESKELSKFRAELIAGGFEPAEAFNIVMT